MDTIVYALLIVHAFFWFGLIGWKYRRHVRGMPRLEAEVPGTSYPRLGVFVPARNEEAGIEASLRSLLAQDYPDLHVIVANDHSTDRTGEILRDLQRETGDERLTVFDVPNLPDGWMGKCHALHRSVPKAPEGTGLYLFTDADVIHEPGTLKRAVSHMRRDNADLFSFFPRLDCVGFWENVALPLMVHSGLSQLETHRINDPASRSVASVGAFILITREMYERWGGHEAIKGEVIDDIAMGMMTKEAGGRACFVRDPHAIHLRMYDSLNSIVRGFEKNSLTAMGGNLFNVVLICALYSFAYLLPAFLTPAAALAGAGLASLATLLYTLALGLSLAVRTREFLDFKPLHTVLFYPAGAFINMVIFLKSAYHGLFEGVIIWRGRKMPRGEQRVRLF